MISKREDEWGVAVGFPVLTFSPTPASRRSAVGDALFRDMCDRGCQMEWLREVEVIRIGNSLRLEHLYSYLQSAHF